MNKPKLVFRLKKPVVISCLFVALCLQGCGVAALSVLGYQETKSKYTRLYDDYRSGKAMDNAENSAMGASASSVLSFHEWLLDQPLNNRELRLMKTYGDLSPEEVDLIKAKRTRQQRIDLEG